MRRGKRLCRLSLIPTLASPPPPSPVKKNAEGSIPLHINSRRKAQLKIYQGDFLGKRGGA
jgi:hypothetical protein